MSTSPSTGGDDLMYGETSDQEEKILVSVRLRPLNEREIARNEVSDWECINNSTIIFKSNMPERSMFPTAYTFDRVFRSDCQTKQVYEEGAKEIALSAVSGVNSTIFAYGQTSSGKTYTMRGITEYALADIYEYTEKHKEREFVLKFSAMEIYNEAVRDLLSTAITPLRLLDDPERGTVVEGLIEDTLIDWKHLQELISICEGEAQRQIGENTLNEASSRSHQILRLTVESSAREYSDAGKSSTLTATVNFVDLAGSERASQTLAVGTRLKEGSHINRSLLTLGTVIRKLSKGRNGHIPYRDSKLTRILQNSLGGNARTAIICTLSPSRSHVEQSRNTLLFASCAKEVSTNAQVNVVMSDKTLVKQLQKELTRLETELKSSRSNSSAGDSIALLREKELQIEKMQQEIKKLTWQRDRAQSHLQSLLKSVGIKDQIFRMDGHSAPESSEMINALRLEGTKFFKDYDDPSAVSPKKQTIQIPEDPEDNFLLDGSTPKFSGQGWEDIGNRNSEDVKDICEQIQGTVMVESRMNVKKEADVVLPALEEEKLVANEEDEAPSSQEEYEELIHINSNKRHDAVKQKIQELHKTITHLERSPSFSEAGESSSKSLKWTRSKSKRSVLMTIPYALWSEKEEDIGSVSPASEKDFHESPEDLEHKLPELEHDVKLENKPQEDSQNSLYGASAEEDIIKDIDVDVEDTASVLDFVAGVNKMAASLRAEHQSRDIRACLSLLHLRMDVFHLPRHMIILRFRRPPLGITTVTGKSYFFLLFKGDPSDNVYMEVELRRLYFLKDTFSRGNNTIIDGKIASPAASLKALNRERDMLAKQLQKKYTKTERERLYQKWGISLDTKQRSLQLARRLWSDIKDVRHIRDSAALVAKLAGLVEPRNAPKEMFGLSFSTSQRPSWRDNIQQVCYRYKDLHQEKMDKGKPLEMYRQALWGGWHLCVSQKCISKFMKRKQALYASKR
ncbi:unnamed protein product [Dovyalis caffra]|uniref:Kinesin-like protein n=1 Tax=Dovyalis caffra TaxID=77055 RepID=A0AAV1S618_9ROSI|nr:unnamed protein product [Dovyalis caffra]